MEELLFSYGTLQLKAVQLKTFGRELEGYKDSITGYMLSQVEITDKDVLAVSGKRFHPILQHTGNSSDIVEGMVFSISNTELLLSDEYEVADYTRVLAHARSGEDVWVYVKI